MEVITKEFKALSYDELSNESKEFAYSKWYQYHEFGWNYEYQNTMSKFCDIFRIKLKNWSVDTYNYVLTKLWFFGIMFL